jgi:hypothetical protein
VPKPNPFIYDHGRARPDLHRSMAPQDLR